MKKGLEIGVVVLVVLAMAAAKKYTSELKENMEVTVTNILTLPEGFEHQENLAKIIETMKTHKAFISIERGSPIMSPNGPTGYSEIVIVKWQSLEGMIDWVDNVLGKMPPEDSVLGEGVQVLFYENG